MNSAHIEHGVTVWRCPGCSFGMAAEHTNDDKSGLDQWECPTCGTTDDGDGTVAIRPKTVETDLVTELQTRLVNLGLYLGDINGRYDHYTQHAVLQMIDDLDNDDCLCEDDL